MYLAGAMRHPPLTDHARRVGAIVEHRGRGNLAGQSRSPDYHVSPALAHTFLAETKLTYLRGGS